MLYIGIGPCNYWSIPEVNDYRTCRWSSARLQYLQCVSTLALSHRDLLFISMRPTYIGYFDIIWVHIHGMCKLCIYCTSQSSHPAVYAIAFQRVTLPCIVFTRSVISEVFKHEVIIHEPLWQFDINYWLRGTQFCLCVSYCNPTKLTTQGDWVIDMVCGILLMWVTF